MAAPLIGDPEKEEYWAWAAETVAQSLNVKIPPGMAEATSTAEGRTAWRHHIGAKTRTEHISQLFTELQITEDKGTKALKAMTLPNHVACSL